MSHVRPKTRFEFRINERKVPPMNRWAIVIRPLRGLKPVSDGGNVTEDRVNIVYSDFL